MPLTAEEIAYYTKICSELRPTEQTVLGLLSEGWSNPYICTEMHYSRNTVSGMLTHIYEALNLTGSNGPVYSNRTRAAYLWHLYKQREDLL